MKPGIPLSLRAQKNGSSTTARHRAGAERPALAFLDAPDPVPNGQKDQVVAGRFGAPVKDRPAVETRAQEAVPAEFLRNMDTALAARRAKGGKSA